MLNRTFFSRVQTGSGLMRSYFGLTGAGFLLASLLIFIFPELVAYLVATVLLWIGAIFIGLALKSHSGSDRDTRQREEYYEIL